MAVKNNYLQNPCIADLIFNRSWILTIIIIPVYYNIEFQSLTINTITYHVFHLHFLTFTRYKV